VSRGSAAKSVVFPLPGDSLGRRRNYRVLLSASAAVGRSKASLFSLNALLFNREHGLPRMCTDVGQVFWTRIFFGLVLSLIFSQREAADAVEQTVSADPPESELLSKPLLAFALIGLRR